MSVTGNYMLVLGCDTPERGTPDREWWDESKRLGEVILHDSMEQLSILIDKVDWDGDEPVRRQMFSHLVYYWENTHGPYFREGPKVYPPVEKLIEKVKNDFPDCEKHYQKIWWVEGNLFQVEGRLLDHNPEPFIMKTVVVCDDSGYGVTDMRTYFREKVEGVS